MSTPEYLAILGALLFIGGRPDPDSDATTVAAIVAVGCFIAALVVWLA